MQQLQLYLQQKQLEENQDRQQHQRFALLAYECEQQLRDYQPNKSNTYIALINYIDCYGYNPFDEQYLNTQAIVQLENYNQIKFEQNLQIALQIDNQLLQYFDKQLRCGTITEEEDDEEVHLDSNDSYVFDPMKGLKLQKEIQLLQKQSKSSKQLKSVQPYYDKDYPSYKQQYQYSSVKKQLKLSDQKSDDYDDIQDFSNKLNQDEQEYQEDQQYNQDQFYQIPQDTQQRDDDQYDIPQFGSYDSVTFKQQLQEQIQFYQNELRISKQSLEKPLLFQSPLKQDLLNKFELTNGNNNIVTSENKNEFNNSEIKYQINSANKFINDQEQQNIPVPISESPQRLRQQQLKKQPQIQQVSLLGSLFTPQVLKEMEYLNDDLLPQQEYSIPVQYQEITVERAFIDERRKQQQQQQQQQPQSQLSCQSQPQSQLTIQSRTIESKQRKRTHPTFSPFRIQMMEEIRDALESKPIVDDLKDGKTQLYVMQQLQSKTNEIFEFTISLAKEVQSKGWLSKQSIIKINDQYKEFSHLLMKKQPNLQQKQDNNSIVQRMYSQMTEYLTTQFIQQLNLQQQSESVYLNAIFTPIIIAIAIVDKDFPRTNSKIPPINLQLIQKTFQNASQTVQTIKQLPKLLLQRQIFQRDLCLFEESLEMLQSLMSQQEAVTIIQNKELYQIIRQCYVIQQCFQLMENLKIENDHVLQLNDNKKYQEQWKLIGTRYASKKNKDEVLQKQNQEMLEKFGIDFYAWQLNLQIQENEIKKIKRMENEQLWKDKRNEKQQQKQAIQKENQDILRENEEQYKLNQAIKEHDKQKKAQEFRERQQQKAYSSVMMKQQQKCDQQDMRKNQSQIIKQSSEILHIQKLDLKNEKDSACKYRQDRINSARGHKKEKQTNSQKKEEEERVWQKAQELLAKQSQLLHQKKLILQQLKNK
ncbi:unnamed protein product [Paramecium primaurelia]|uniref:Uncharacterized protein n=1 Tax=Paramecium primaurelia TaxID=5886 RepID=A0A8S1QJE7_PARPR|nr:unnamed protein product [Paramecium primaurelia]